MTSLEFLLIFICALCCTAAPAPDSESPEVSCSTKEKQFKNGEVAHFKCLQGMTLEGPSSSQCTSHGWDPALPRCKDQWGDTVRPLIDPDKVPEMTCPTKEKLFEFGDFAHFKCLQGMTLDGPSSSRCTSNGWNPALPICKDQWGDTLRPLIDSDKDSSCESPPEITNGKRREQKTTYLTGEKAYYDCNPGFSMTRRRTGYVTCLDGLWTEPPACKRIGQPCGPPPVVQHGDITDRKKLNYPSGSSVKYQCINLYKLEGNERIMCQDGEWDREPICRVPCTASDAVMKQNNIKLKYLPNDKKIYSEHGDSMSFICLDGYEIANISLLRSRCWDGVINLPKCFKRRIGQPCGPPPVVNHGDITDTKRLNYPSGSSVQYQCINFYKLEGNEKIKCQDGEWDKEPICRVPCTVNDVAMKQNNMKLKYLPDDRKVYMEHGNSMSFLCLDGYEIADTSLLRVQCLDGVINLPKCFKKGSCLLKHSEMFSRNILYNHSPDIENGKTIVFQCVEGTIAKGTLEAKCVSGQIQYPECVPIAPCVLNQEEMTKQNIYYNQGIEIKNGETIVFECAKGSTKEGSLEATCRNGQITYPKCVTTKSCNLSDITMEEKHIELVQPNDNKILQHDEEIMTKCKASFRYQGGIRTISCLNGKISYPKCFPRNKGICRIDQDELDINSLLLHDKHDGEVFYEEGETVEFKCSSGHKHKGELIARCVKSKEADEEFTLTYPRCEEISDA